MKSLLNDGVLLVTMDDCQGEKRSRRINISTPDGKMEVLVRLYEGKTIDIALVRGKASLHPTLAVRLVIQAE